MPSLLALLVALLIVDLRERVQSDVHNYHCQQDPVAASILRRVVCHWSDLNSCWYGSGDFTFLVDVG